MRSGDGIMGKAEGWFYLTPVFRHPFFDELKALKGDYNGRSYEDVVADNTETYGQALSVNTAFIRQVTPLLSHDWEKHIDAILSVGLVDQSDILKMSVGEKREELQGLLYKEFIELSRRSTPVEQIVDKKRRRLYPMTHELLDHLQSDSHKRYVVEFFREVIEQRHGLLIGFNERVLQGKIVSSLYDTQQVCHGNIEIAVCPESGNIDLSGCIVGIEPIGDYEQEILEALGLVT